MLRICLKLARSKPCVSHTQLQEIVGYTKDKDTRDWRAIYVADYQILSKIAMCDSSTLTMELRCIENALYSTLNLQQELLSCK